MYSLQSCFFPTSSEEEEKSKSPIFRHGAVQAGPTVDVTWVISNRSFSRVKNLWLNISKMQVVWSSEMCSLDKACECWLTLLSYTFMLAVTVFCKAIFTSLTRRTSHPRVKLFIGEKTEKMRRRKKIQMVEKKNWEGSSSLYGVLLAPVAVQEDFSFSFGANTSLVFLLGFKASRETSQTV